MSTARNGAAVRAAEVELLGLVAYGSLAAFERTAASSAAAESIADKLQLARIAAQRFSHLDRLEQELVTRSSNLQAAMTPFAPPVDAFNQHTEPKTWSEALVKLCVVGGLVQDFASLVGPGLDPELQAILTGSIDDAELAPAPGRMLAAALAANPDDQGRLTLFARRLLGELLSQAQRVAARHPGLTSLITGHDQNSGDDLAEVSELMSRLAAAHADRMIALGLAQ
ncbi:ferritin-like fold-containing protein [Luteococcus sp. Sow4_B9]|uniref:ferritin-like fold-containing protein n=1 Tax=Luteococcus sp. Sow4_B9 TaxID=3438792 RepID=UPI003F96CC09